ncbi:MAG: hypothetical protein K8R36_01405 [Planctomycetales bacterium]|nr:hypothetical protein [Planctomycetales bacterium]
MTSFRFSIREIFLVTLVAALVFGWGTQSYIRSWPSSHEKALMQERLEALQEVARARRNSHAMPGDGGKAARDAECDALAAELELCATSHQRQIVLEKMFAIQQQYERNQEVRYDKGSGTAYELGTAKADRLKVEILLERAKAGR